MDWNNVSWWEVLSAFREADWRQRPQPLHEFLQPNRFSLPKTRAKWSSRAKNNAFYYHVNYIFILTVILASLCLQRPKAAAAVAFAALAVATLNDTFTASLLGGASTAAAFMARRSGMRLQWRLSRGAAGSTAPTSLGHSLPGGRGGNRSGRFQQFLQRALSAAITALAIFLTVRTGAVVRMAAGVVAGAAIILVHATFRSPNLKARLGSARDEFRALWRGYQEIDTIDYTV